MSPEGWTQGDAFVVPFWQDQQMLGQIILDDPKDGVPPRDASKCLLERIASIASAALSGSCELKELSRERGLLRFFTDYAMTGLLVVQEQSIRYANDQLVNILGYDKEYLARLTPWWNFFHPDDRPAVWDVVPKPTGTPTRVRAIRKDGRVIWLNMSIHSVLYAEGEATAFQFYDVTDRIEAEELLREKALRDPLTGFRNRGYFDEAIQIELQRSKRYRREFTLIMADLANFKQVNDQLGHQEGDRILAGIADIIRKELRESDWVVRYGGDEFLLVLPETGSSLGGLVARLTQSIDAWCSEKCGGIPLGIDFGWATWSCEEPKAITDLVRAADVMLYENKAHHKAILNGSVSTPTDSGGSDKQ
ncbi:diguanylate cyclase [Candidatus Bipolaricaulota bacterium]